MAGIRPASVAAQGAATVSSAGSVAAKKQHTALTDALWQSIWATQIGAAPMSVAPPSWHSSGERAAAERTSVPDAWLAERAHGVPVAVHMGRMGRETGTVDEHPATVGGKLARADTLSTGHLEHIGPSGRGSRTLAGGEAKADGPREASLAHEAIAPSTGSPVQSTRQNRQIGGEEPRRSFAQAFAAQRNTGAVAQNGLGIPGARADRGVQMTGHPIPEEGGPWASFHSAAPAPRGGEEALAPLVHAAVEEARGRPVSRPFHPPAVLGTERMAGVMHANPEPPRARLATTVDPSPLQSAATGTALSPSVAVPLPAGETPQGTAAWATVLQTIVRQVEAGVNQVRIQLSPPGLGGCWVSVSHAHSGIRIRVVVERSDTKALFDASAAELLNALVDAGVRVAGLSISLADLSADGERSAGDWTQPELLDVKSPDSKTAAQTIAAGDPQVPDTPMASWRTGSISMRV